MVAFPLLVFALTGSSASAGLVGFLRSLPFALLQLPAGGLVDCWGDISFGSLIGGLSLESADTTWTLLAIVLWMLVTFNRAVRHTPPLVWLNPKTPTVRSRTGIIHG